VHLCNLCRPRGGCPPDCRRAKTYHLRRSRATRVPTEALSTAKSAGGHSLRVAPATDLRRDDDATTTVVFGVVFPNEERREKRALLVSVRDNNWRGLVPKPAAATRESPHNAHRLHRELG